MGEPWISYILPGRQPTASTSWLRLEINKGLEAPLPKGARGGKVNKSVWGPSNHQHLKSSFFYDTFSRFAFNGGALRSHGYGWHLSTRFRGGTSGCNLACGGSGRQSPD